ncbi:hypothetical protein H4S03_003963 [Coemansia sp. S3946]|nr:hypothetical protein H4S03_003963 [Coemansia sp. S3946]
MDKLVQYLLDVIQSSYQDLEYLVPCGSFLGLFDERPIKRTRTDGPRVFEFDDSESTCNSIRHLTLTAISSGTMPAVDVLRVVVDAVRNIHDASAVLDIGFRSLFEIYQKRLSFHCANRYTTGVVGGTFGEEYLILTKLFELHRPRTWVAAVRLVSMVTKSAIGIMYGGTTPGEAPSLSTGTHAASLSEISGINFLPEAVCRETIRVVWRLLLDSAATERQPASVLGSARRTRWQIRFDATLELFDCFVGRSGQCLGRPLVSYYTVARELDPGAAVAESGLLTDEMQAIVDLCFARKRRLGRILLPPDGSWPLISHASRAHTVKHVYDQPAYALVRDSLTFEETERGPSANKYVADLLYQRAPTDEIFAAIRNHRITKKKAMAAVANDSYVPNRVPGSVAVEESVDAEKHEVAQLLLEAMAQRIEQTVRYIQRQCDFETLLNERKLNDNSDASMIVPRNIQYWEHMNEIADQLYYFVLFDAIPYKAVHERLYSLVFPKDSDIQAGGSMRRRDNSYIWLLLQLFHIEKVAAGPIRADLAGDEDMLDQLMQMYNEQQIVSKDAFYVRDLALQAAMSHQQEKISDNQGVKFRHPRMAVAMPFAAVVFRLRQEFGRWFREERPELLAGDTVCRAMKTAAVSQFRQYAVPNALYTFLVPPREAIGQLPSGPLTTYQQGGRISTLLLDNINVGGKHRLLQLVYKMMLAHEMGPQFQVDGRPPAARDGITCVSPHVVDTVYRLLYNAPYSNELMMKEVLEKLRRCDEAMVRGGVARLAAPTLRWLYTVYQLMNCRLLRFFKYYAHASHLVHHLRHSLVHVTHRQLYGSLECFALCLVNLQHDVGFLQALLDPGYHGVSLEPVRPEARPVRYSKPAVAWFACAMLARNAAVVIARIVAMRGLGDAPGLVLEDCLASLPLQPLPWAPAVLRFLPRPVRAYYARASSAEPVVAAADVRRLIDARPEHRALVDAGAAPGSEAALVALYADARHRPLFLLTLWELLLESPRPVIPVVRRVLLAFPPSQMSACTAALVDYIAAAVDDVGLGTVGPLLDSLMFTFRFVQHEHVVFGLVRGVHDLRGDTARLALVRHVLLGSVEFVARLAEWQRLDFQGRYWADVDHWRKQEAYLARFPEYFEYEAQLVKDGVAVDPPPALPLPIYYETAMVRLLPVLEFALGRLIEAEDRSLLCDVLDRLGILYRLHQVPLTTLMNTLFVFFDAPALHDPTVMRSLALSLLDMTQQSFTPEFTRFVAGGDWSVDAGYVCRMLARISRAIARHLRRPEKDALPESHYREIPNPILLVLTECVVELLTWWCLHQAPASEARLLARPESEAEFRAEEAARTKRAAAWPVARLWLDIAMDPAAHPPPSGATYIHSTGLLANVLPDELMAFPFVQHLTNIVLEEPVLKTISRPKRYFSFVEFALPATFAQPSPLFAATAVFNSYEQNRARHMVNRPNTYLTLLHSILHYGGIGTFNTLAEVIRGLVASGQLCSDIQLLYLCATVGPILYRLKDHELLYVQILGDLVSAMAQVCPHIESLDIDTSTDAVEQVMDFFCFVKDQFDPGRSAWRSIAPHIAALPSLLRYQLQSIVDQ